MSARPGLCGGHRATGVPTAIVNLRASSEGAQCDSLLAVDFENRMQPCHLEEVSNFFVDLKKFHLASLLSDGAETSHQFAHATAVHVINSREIEQESFVAGFGENMYQVPQLRAALGCREFANDVHDNDSVELSCGDFKTHGEFARFCFPRAGSYRAWTLLSMKPGENRHSGCGPPRGF
jgi:hypothetical protein